MFEASRNNSNLTNLLHDSTSIGFNLSLLNSTEVSLIINEKVFNILNLGRSNAHTVTNSKLLHGIFSTSAENLREKHQNLSYPN